MDDSMGVCGQYTTMMMMMMFLFMMMKTDGFNFN